MKRPGASQIYLIYWSSSVPFLFATINLQSFLKKMGIGYEYEDDDLTD
jgi:hypothetical protein